MFSRMKAKSTQGTQTCITNKYMTVRPQYHVISMRFCTCSYPGFESSLTDIDLMHEYDQPPKKKSSTILRKESCGDTPYFFPSFLANQSEVDTDLQGQTTATKSNLLHAEPDTPGATSMSAAHIIKRDIVETIPPMSKLSMNIGYARHLATAAQQVESQQYPRPATDTSHYSSYNLLSRSQATGRVTGVGLSLDSNGNPISNQQAYYAGVREAQRQPPCQDYPMQSQQLSSMYACNRNSSSINDFKLLMVQTSPSDFSNGNDGSIWQPRLKAINSVSNDISSSNSLAASHNNSFDEIECYDYDDVPSFDEAMDMMAARIL